jgi:hypothetical protein
MMNKYEIEPSMDRKTRRLAASTTTTSETTRKRTRINVNVDSNPDKMPEYLMAKNKLFDRMIRKVIDIACSIDIEDVRQIAFCIHHLNSFNQLYDLWSIYLQAGKGTLRDEEEEVSEMINTHRRYWPKRVKLLSLEENSPLSSDMTEEQKQLKYELVVYRRLRHYREKIQYYQQLINEKKRHLIGFTQKIEENIELFVQQYAIVYLQMKCNFAIVMLNHDYDDHLLRYEYQQEKPTDYQVCWTIICLY